MACEHQWNDTAAHIWGFGPHHVGGRLDELDNIPTLLRGGCERQETTRAIVVETDMSAPEAPSPGILLTRGTQHEGRFNGLDKSKA